jgi:hypothetical protein
MATPRVPKIVVGIQDTNGSFGRFLKNAPKEIKAALADAVKKTSFALERRMMASAPVGPAGEGLTPEQHIKPDITHRARDLSGWAGIKDDSDQATVMFFNEYQPNEQAFMLPAAKAEADNFRKLAEAALKQVERDLSGGGGLI